MKKIFRILLIILAILVLLFALYGFFNLTGKVILEDEEGNKDVNSLNNEEVDRDINNYEIVNKTNPSNLDEGECLVLENGRKFCMVKKQAKVEAGKVTG